MADNPDYEGDDDIVEYYENKESDDERGSLGVIGETATSDNEGETARRIDPSKSKTHTVRNPIPKLNTERLKGPNGIHTIEKYFEGFKFYGKGHEKKDLDRIMKRLEHWSYRLFPKYHFDDFLTRVEQLGAKKDLQVFIKRYRLDMLTSDDNNDLIIHDNSDNEEDQQESVPLDDFDLLITEQIEKQKQNKASVPAAPSTSNEDAFDELLMQSDNVRNSQIQDTSTARDKLSEEVKEKIERNKQLALQRRLQREKAREEAKRTKLIESTNIETLNENNNPTVYNETDASQVDSTRINENTNETIAEKFEEILSNEEPTTDHV